jgi:hypothetical protein
VPLLQFCRGRIVFLDISFFIRDIVRIQPFLCLQAGGAFRVPYKQLSFVPPVFVTITRSVLFFPIMKKTEAAAPKRLCRFCFCFPGYSAAGSAGASSACGSTMATLDTFVFSATLMSFTPWALRL